MMFRLTTPWPIADKVVPTGTLIDGQSNDDWTNLARGKVPPPFSAQALDQQAFDAIWMRYPTLRHLIMSGEGVKRRT